jgi:hypothetical protein
MCPRQLGNCSSEAESSFHMRTTNESRLASPFDSFRYSGGFSGNSTPHITTNALHNYAGTAYPGCLLVRLSDVSDSNGKLLPLLPGQFVESI